MKNLFAFTMALFLSVGLFAQEGHLSYSIEIGGDDPQIELMKSFFAGATMDMYFTDNFSRVDMNMGSMMTTKVITNLKNEEVLTLMTGMMGNIATKSTLEADLEEDEDFEVDIELIDEAKTIAGLSCKKAIITSEEGNEFEMWYTNDIAAKDMRGLAIANQKGLPGFPVEFAMQQGPMTMHFSLTNYSKKFDKKSIFDMTIPEGFVEKTADELRQMGQ
jgi:GLPGLI family protein